GHEMSLILPRDVVLRRELEVGLVNETGRGQRASACPDGELPSRNRTQVIVDVRNNAVERASTSMRRVVRAGRADIRRLHRLLMFRDAIRRRRAGNVARRAGMSCTCAK